MSGEANWGKLKVDNILARLETGFGSFGVMMMELLRCIKEKLALRDFDDVRSQWQVGVVLSPFGMPLGTSRAILLST